MLCSYLASALLVPGRLSQTWAPLCLQIHFSRDPNSHTQSEGFQRHDEMLARSNSFKTPEFMDMKMGGRILDQKNLEFATCHLRALSTDSLRCF